MVREPWEMTKDELELRGKKGVKAKDSDALIDYGEVGESRIVWGGEVETLTELPLNQVKPDPSATIYRDYSILTEDMPPIEVDIINGKYEVMDGSNRLVAAQQRGDKTIKAWVSKTTPKNKIETHRDIVQKALSEGKPVPPEVLEAYSKTKGITNINDSSLSNFSSATDIANIIIGAVKSGMDLDEAISAIRDEAQSAGVSDDTIYQAVKIVENYFEEDEE